MKKIVLMSLLALLAGTSRLGQSNLIKENINPTNIKFENDEIAYPNIGDSDPTSPMGSIWQSGSYGFKRISDLATAVRGTPGWGMRCDYGNKRFNRDEIEISLNLKDYTKGDFLGITFGDRGSYMSEGSSQLGMDILPYSFAERPHDYMVTLNTSGSTGAGHNTSMEGWSNNEEAPWLDAYSGVIVTAEDDTLVIGFKVNGDNVDVHVNEVSISLPKSRVYQTLAQTFCVNFATGGNPGDKLFVVNYVLDGADKAYYDQETGLFYTVKSEINEFYEAVETTPLNTIEDFVTLYTLASKVDLSGLYSYDQLYLGNAFNAKVAQLKDEAVTKFGNAAFIELYRSSVDKLHALITALDDESTLLQAISLVEEIKPLKTTIEGLTLTDDETTTFNSLSTTFEADMVLVSNACHDIYQNQVEAVIKKLDDASDAISIKDAQIAYASISKTFRDYMDATELDALEGRLASSYESFIARTTLPNTALFTQGDNIRAIQDGDSLGFVAHGDTSSGKCLVSKEKLDVIDFSMTYDIKQFQKYSIALMNDPAGFSAAEDATVQEHKGLIFLIRAKSETQAYVESYLIDGTCNRFFDGQLSQTTFDIPKDGKITLNMKVELVNQSGIYDNYLTYNFNGCGYDTPLIKAASLLGAFDDQKGYLVVGPQGGNVTEPLAMNIDEVNGNKLSGTTLRKDVDYTPEFGVESLEFKKGSTQNLIAPINTKIQKITEVKVDSKALELNSNYTYTRNSTITLKASYLNTLEAGEHTLTVETEKGNKDIKLVITGDSTTGGDTTVQGEETGKNTTEAPSKKKGCGGSIIATSATLGSLAILAGVTAVVKKKREDK